jgi:hypothetical protein
MLINFIIRILVRLITYVKIEEFLSCNFSLKYHNYQLKNIIITKLLPLFECLPRSGSMRPMACPHALSVKFPIVCVPL